MWNLVWMLSKLKKSQFEPRTLLWPFLIITHCPFWLTFCWITPAYETLKCRHSIQRQKAAFWRGRDKPWQERKSWILPGLISASVPSPDSGLQSLHDCGLSHKTGLKVKTNPSHRKMTSCMCTSARKGGSTFKLKKKKKKKTASPQSV